jgi:ribosomal protein S7
MASRRVLKVDQSSKYVKKKMSRRRRAKKRTPDPTYDSRFIHMLNLSHGKKSLAYKIVYQTMESIAEKHNKIQLKF